MKKKMVITAVLFLGLSVLLPARSGTGSKGGGRGASGAGEGRTEQGSSMELQSLTGILEKSDPFYVLHSDQDYYPLGDPDFLETLPWETGDAVTVTGMIIQDTSQLPGPLMDILQDLEGNNRLVILQSVTIGDEVFEAPRQGAPGAKA